MNFPKPLDKNFKKNISHSAIGGICLLDPGVGVPCVTVASSLAQNLPVMVNGYRCHDTSTQLLIGVMRRGDTSASGCQQNNISKQGRLDLLHRWVVDLAQVYL